MQFPFGQLQMHIMGNGIPFRLLEVNIKINLLEVGFGELRQKEQVTHTIQLSCGHKC
jgi:hypothetical protein